MFAQLKVVVDLLTTGVTDAWSIKTKLERKHAVLRMLETYFLLKDCVDEGSALIAEAGSDPVKTLSGLSQEVAQETVTRWDVVLRKQGSRLYSLQGYIYGQDHLTIVAPNVQELIGKAIGSKFDRVVNLQGIGAALFFYQVFPLAANLAEKASYISLMAGSRNKHISLSRIKKEVRALREGLNQYRVVIEKLVSHDEIVKLSEQARKKTRYE